MRPSDLVLPTGVRAMAVRGPVWASWVDRLPRLVVEVVEEWELAPDGSPMHGHGSLVLPVRDRDGQPAALKLTCPLDDETVHEHLALRQWDGDGTVRLLRADPHRRVLLLERLSTRDLSQEWDVGACEVVGDLYARLHRPALPQLVPLTTYVERWVADLADLPRSAPLPHRLVEQAVSRGRAFAADPASTGRTIHGDLHYTNVLAPLEGMQDERGPWLVIDPQPVDGDPHYELAPMLWNRWDELAGDVRGGVRRRFEALVDAAGLEEDRARDWVVVRMLVNASWELADAVTERRAPDGDHLTMCVALAKAVQE